MPDGCQVDWNYDTIRQIAMLLTVDKNGKDATQAGFDPKNIVQYGFEPQRDDLRGLGAYWGAGQLLGPTARQSRSRPPGRPPGSGSTTASGPTTSSRPTPVWNSQAFNGGGYTFNSGKVAMQENFLWNVCCVTEAGEQLGPGGDPVQQRHGHRGIQRRHLPDPQDHQAPRRGVHRPDLPPRRRLDPAPQRLQRLSRPDHGPGRLLPAAQPAEGCQGQADLPAQRQLAGRHRRHPVRRQPELRGVHAGLQPVGRPADQVPDPLDLDARPGHGQRDRQPPIPAPGHLGQVPVEPGDSTPAGQATPPRAACPTRGPLGLLLPVAVDHRLPRVHADPDDRHAGVHVHQRDPDPGHPAPFRRPGQLRQPGQRPDNLGVAGSDPQVRGPGPAGRGPGAVRGGPPAQQPAPQGRRASSGSCSSCPTWCRSWPAS